MFDALGVDEEEMALKEGPKYLLFYLNGELLGLFSSKIREIVELPKVTKVPWMQESLCGVCNIRGSVVGVVDTSWLLMQQPFEQTQKSSLVLVDVAFEGKEESVGLIVDEVFEVEVFEPERLQETPNFGLAFDSKYVQSMAKYEESHIPILSLERLLCFEELARVEAGNA